jgi:dynein heavy chain 2, cytosolic
MQHPLIRCGAVSPCDAGQVRQLQTLGFSVKKDILSEVDVAQRFYRYGMVLKQHANFYNNISTQMVPCQKPMMLKDALDFEKVSVAGHT